MFQSVGMMGKWVVESWEIGAWSEGWLMGEEGEGESSLESSLRKRRSESFFF